MQAPQIAKNGRTTGFAQTPPTGLGWNTGALGLVTTVSFRNPFLQGGFINTSILGFNRTSPNFKLELSIFFWVSTFIRYYNS